MSAAVCGSKRSYFTEVDAPSPPASKKLRRRSSTSPVRLPSPSFSSSPLLLHHLLAVFPHADHQLLERTLEECGHDLDLAIRSLRDNVWGSAEHDSGSAKEAKPNLELDKSSAPSSLPTDGAAWVELLVREMASATSVEDARARASRVLDSLEKSVSVHATKEASNSFQKESMMLKEQIEPLIRENTILKKAVAIQYERQKEFEDKNQELQHLKQLVSQYQEQLRILEVKNYSLMMHLRQAEQGSPIPGRFHPDVF